MRRSIQVGLNQLYRLVPSRGSDELVCSTLVSGGSGLGSFFSAGIEITGLLLLASSAFLKVLAGPVSTFLGVSFSFFSAKILCIVSVLTATGDCVVVAPHFRLLTEGSFWVSLELSKK